MAFSIHIQPQWNVIKSVKDAIDEDEDIIRNGPDFIDATKIASIELVENALKYSDPEENEQPIIFDLKNSDGHIVIRVTNYCVNEEARNIIRTTIDDINNNDPFDLYVKRLEMIRDSPDGHSRLGFYRIGYEAEYQLSYKLTEKLVVIIGKRKL